MYSLMHRKYSQIEKECLAICHALDKFDHSVYGKANVTVHTDHQPLEMIFSKSLSKAPLMRLERHTFAVVYKVGKSLTLCLAHPSQ